MIQLCLVILHLILVLLLPHVEADMMGQPEYVSPEYSSLQPSLIVVIGILSIMSMITLLLLVYVKLCHRRDSADTNQPQNDTVLVITSNRVSGVDKSVIESLPFFRFSSLKGTKEGLECAVCLSKFEDVEVLRLLPKCKHAFHINCIDHWLEKHSSCPLCRHKVSIEDLTPTGDSNSARFLSNNPSGLREDSNNIELFVQREQSQRGSSRFSIGSSFRKIFKKGGEKENHLFMRKETEADQKIFHRHNHKLTISGFHLNNRWSDLSSSDLMFLNSEMLNDMSSGRFSSTDWNNDISSTGKSVENKEIMKAEEEIEFGKSLQSKAGITTASASSSLMNCGEQRSVSEIASLSRFTESSSMLEENVEQERSRRVWLPIARRTVQWFANREKTSQRQTLDV